MKRREFIGGLAGAAWSRAAWAQQSMPVVGFLRSATLSGVPHFVEGCRAGLKETGFVDGQNVAMEFSSAEGDNDRLPELVGDLIRRPAAVIVANGTAALAVKAVSTTVPVIFVTGSDPVREGLVASLHKPGANVTGVLFFASTLGTKRWELLRQLVPAATRIAILCNPNSLNTETELMEVQGAADAMGRHLVIVPVTSGSDIEAASARPRGYRGCSYCRFWGTVEFES